MSGVESKQAFLACGYERNIGYMEGVLVKILSRLPVKNLVDCKLVSKFWYKLIGELQFAELQFSCSPEKRKYIIYLDGDESDAGKKLYIMDKNGIISPFVTLPIIDKISSFKLICSFNGLICFTKSVGDTDLDILISNPSTREILKLPKGSPSTEPPSIGIIFEPNKIKYKVLRFFCDPCESEGTAWKCEIYSPGAVDWRVIVGVVDPPVANPACPLFPTHVSVGGKIYWLVWSKRNREMPDHILSIDMDENITRIRLPLVDNDPEENLDDSEESSNESNIFNLLTFLIDYEDRLAVVSVDDDESQVHIWSLTNPEEPTWPFQGDAVLQVDGNIDAINSIVSVGKELMFIFRENRQIFHFLNLAKTTWRLPGLTFMCEGCDDGGDIRRKLRYRRREPVAFPFSESLFKCDVANYDRRGDDF